MRCLAARARKPSGPGPARLAGDGPVMASTGRHRRHGRSSAVACVARPGALLIDHHQQHITIAVVAHAAHVLAVPRGLPLAPEFLSAPTPEPGAPGLERLAQRLAAHPGEHQDGLVAGLLDDGRNQAVVVEFDPGQLVLGERDWPGRVGGGRAAGAHGWCSLCVAGRWSDSSIPGFGPVGSPRVRGTAPCRRRYGWRPRRGCPARAGSRTRRLAPPPRSDPRG